MAYILRTGHGKGARSELFKNLSKSERRQLVDAKQQSHEEESGVVTIEFRGKTINLSHDRTLLENKDDAIEIDTDTLEV